MKKFKEMSKEEKVKVLLEAGDWEYGIDSFTVLRKEGKFKTVIYLPEHQSPLMYAESVQEYEEDGWEVVREYNFAQSLSGVLEDLQAGYNIEDYDLDEL